MPDRIVGYWTGPTSGMREALVDAVEQRQAQIATNDADTETESEIAEDARRDREIFLDSRQTYVLRQRRRDPAGAAASLASPVGDHASPTRCWRPSRPAATDRCSRSPRPRRELGRASPSTSSTPSSGCLRRRRTSATTSTSRARPCCWRRSTSTRRRMSGSDRCSGAGSASSNGWSSGSVAASCSTSGSCSAKKVSPNSITDADLSDGELFYVSRCRRCCICLGGPPRACCCSTSRRRTSTIAGRSTWSTTSATPSVLPRLYRDAAIRSSSPLIRISPSRMPTRRWCDFFWVAEDGRIEVSEPPASTFGAAPGDLGHLLFGLESPIGNFANRLLEKRSTRTTSSSCARSTG